MLQCKGSLVGECWRCTERVSVCEAEICHRPVGMRSISRGAGAETLDPMASWYLLVSVGCMINIDKLLTFWSCEYAFQKKPFKEAKVWLQFASLELIWIDHCLKACLAVNPLVQWNHGRVLSCGEMPMSIFLIVRISCSMEPSIQSMVRALASQGSLPVGTWDVAFWCFLQSGNILCSCKVSVVFQCTGSLTSEITSWLSWFVDPEQKERTSLFWPPWCY